MSIDKQARSHSSDPAQENLRERKQIWNSACSDFIARLNAFKPHLISFKRGLNGRGDVKAGLPISNIKDPLPSAIQAYLGAISSEFNELASTFAALANEANHIVHEQTMYSTRRRKKQQRPSQKSNSQLSLANVKTNDDIIIQGSNALTRWWAGFLADISLTTQQRLSMLSLAYDLFENFVEFEDVILTKGVDNIPEVLNFYFRISNKIKAFNLSLQRLEALIEQKSSDKQLENFQPNQTTLSPEQDISNKKEIQPNTLPKNIEFNVDDDTPIEHLLTNIQIMLDLGIGFTIKDISQFKAIYHVMQSSKDESKKELMEDRLRQLYNEIFLKFRKLIKENFNVELPVIVTLYDILEIKKQAFINDSEINKFSSNYLSRRLKEFSHYFGEKDPSSAPRIQILNAIKKSKKYIDEIMDLLEKKKVDLESLKNKKSKLEELIIAMGEPLKLLNVLYMDKYYGDKKTYKDINLDPAGRYFTKQIRKDVDTPGW